MSDLLKKLAAIAAKLAVSETAQPNMQLKKDAGNTTENTAEIETVLTEAMKEMYKKDSVAFLSKIPVVTVNTGTGVIESPFISNADAEPEISGGCKEGGRAPVARYEVDKNTLKFKTTGRESRVTQELMWGSHEDLVALAANKCLESYYANKSKAVLNATSIPVGKAVISSVSAGVDGDLEAGNYSVVVIPLTAKALNQYKRKSVLNTVLMSQVEVTYSNEVKEKRNNGLGVSSDESAITVLANGSITVNVAHKFGVFGNAVFVKKGAGKFEFQGIKQALQFTLKSLAVGSQELDSTLILSTDCSAEENIYGGFLELISNSADTSRTRVLANGERLVEGAKGRVAQVDNELIESFDLDDVTYSEIHMSPAIYQEFNEIANKDVVAVINVQSDSKTASTRRGITHYSHPSDPSLDLKIVVNKDQPDVIIFWSDSVPESQVGVDYPIRLVQRKPVHPQLFGKNDRAEVVAFYCSDVLDIQFKRGFKIIKNITL